MARAISAQGVTFGGDLQPHQPPVKPYPVVNMHYIITPPEVFKGGKWCRRGSPAVADLSFLAEDLFLSHHHYPLGGEEEAGLEVTYHNHETTAMLQGMGGERLLYVRFMPEVIQELQEPLSLPRRLYGEIDRPFFLQPPLDRLC